MNWKEYIFTEINKQDKDTCFDFNLPASEKSIAKLKSELELEELPDELEELYRQTNGIQQRLEEITIGYLVWTIENLIETNQQLRTYPDFKDLFMSFNELLFFSDAGNGDLFGFVALNGKFNRFDIYVWNHEDDSRTWVAPNLKKFIEWWTNGTIKV